jgi:hypothetical protein
MKAYRHWDKLSILLGVCAVIYALPTLGYPFGRDQAIYHYIGRWWPEGVLPYRDFVEFKPPGIFLWYRLSVHLFGIAQWGVRVLDILVTVIIGSLASLAVVRSQPRVRGELGACILISAGLYHTCFDYWNTAQPDRILGAFALAAYASAIRLPGLKRAAFWSGILSACALMVKPSAAVLSLGIVIASWTRTRQETSHESSKLSSLARVGCLHGAGLLAICGIVLAYFAWYQAATEMIDIVVFGAFHYVAQWRTPLLEGLAGTAKFWGSQCAVWTAMLIGAGIYAGWSVTSTGEKQARRHLSWAAGMVFLSVASVFAQGKFFIYHWGVVVPFLVLIAAYGVHYIFRLDVKRGVAFSGIVLVVGVLGAPPSTEQLAARKWPVESYRTLSLKCIAYALGNLDRQAFLEEFVGAYRYRYLEQEGVGLTVAALANPGDRMQVSGFEPTIYAVADLRSPSRFAQENVFQDRRYTFRRHEWQSEHQDTLKREPPRFMVIFSHDRHYALDLTQRGYRVIASQGHFLILELRPNAINGVLEKGG